MNYARIHRGPMAADALGRHFTQIANLVFRDPRLHAKSMGVFGHISTHRDGYGITAETIAASMADGVSAVRGALRELEQYGYLVRRRERRTNGTLGETVYEITDMPEGLLLGAPALGEDQGSASQPDSENRTLAATSENVKLPRSEPTCDSPTLEKPPVENRRTKKTNTQKINPQKTQEMPPSSAPPAPGGEQSSLLGDEHPAPAPSLKKTGSRKTKARTNAEQDRFEQADAIARAWWARCEEKNIPNLRRSNTGNTGFVGFRQMLERALASGFTVSELKWALEDISEAFPSNTRLQNAVAKRRGVIPQQSGYGKPKVRVHIDNVPQAERDFAAAAFGETPKNGASW
ncbi:hypothetical protein GCM10017673_57580 [Streptosporangium violaceochromogenes]|nr:hypothetical protein GCM10017673_57580 [Streptosporangium violaceochromogenes]